MTSKEKLDSLVFKCAFSEYDNIDEFIELHIKQSSDYKAIYQDLDRLQELEQENEDLKEELELLKKKYYELKDMLSSGNL